MNNEILFKPNGLILSKKLTTETNITSSEYKLYDALLQRCQLTKDYGWRCAEISREEIMTIIKNNNLLTIDAIKRIFDKFVGVKIKFKFGTKHVTSTLLAEHVYDEVTDVFSCSLSENVFSALMTYNEIGYSPIDLKLVRAVDGYYTQKIYGLLRMWSKQKQKIIRVYDVDAIKEVCDIVSGTSYDLYSNFKNRVLKPAVKEINSKLNMTVDYREIKKSRRVVQIEFSFIDYEPKRYEFSEEDLVEASFKVKSNKEAKDKINDGIDNMDYVNLIDMNLNESIHKRFMNDFSDYKDYIKAVEIASRKTLDSVGGKTINKRNYNYFKTSLENLLI